MSAPDPDPGTADGTPPPTPVAPPPTYAGPWVPPYGAPPPGPAPRTNGFAVASLAVSLVSLTVMLFIPLVTAAGSVLGAVFGHLALRQLRREGPAVHGRGMAIAGLVMGYVGIGWSAVVVVVITLALLAAGTG